MAGMQVVLKAPIRNLFVVTIVAKVALSFFAWLVTSPWILGFWAPLAIMAAYIVIGLARRGDDTSDEKFGDSCYYLGFIFTISSIAFALFDVPQLNQEGKLKEVAVRFGAAMVSTFFGIIIRIYLVGFKNDADQAMDRLEERVVAAADDLRGRIELSIDAFRHFEGKVHEGAKDVVARSNLAFETLGKTFAAEFAGALNQVTAESRQVFALAANEVQAAAKGMSEDLRRAIKALDDDVRAREAESQRIIQELRARVNAVSVPDDFFVRRLEPALSGLAVAVGTVEQQMKTMASSINESAAEARAAVKQLGATMKASDTQFAAARKHEEVLASLASSMTQASQVLASSAEVIRDERRLVAEMNAAVTEQRGVGTEVVRGLAQAGQLISSSAAAIKELSARAHEQRGAEELTAKALRSSAEQMAVASERLQGATKSIAEVLRELVAVKQLLAHQPIGATAAPRTAAPPAGQQQQRPPPGDLGSPASSSPKRSIFDVFRGR